jgi:hypothetical protein
MATVGRTKRLQCVGFSIPEIARTLRKRFPRLKVGEFAVTSCPDINYNCIGWAAGKTQFWWPVDGYWPDGVPRQLTLDAFMQAFATLGYEVCDDVTYEKGAEKIAIFAGDTGPLHAARQIGSGNKWTSKLGQFADMTHRLIAIEGNDYGRKVIVMKRPRAD